MSKRTWVAAMAAMTVMGLSSPASANHTPPGEPFTPLYVETPVYLHCNGPARLGNVHATVDGDFVTWDGTKPTASATGGAGCGTLDTFAAGSSNHNPIYDFPVKGTFTGNIDNITISFWAIELAGSRALNQFTVDVHLQIDGQDILTRVKTNAARDYMTPSGDGTSPARLYEVTVTKVKLDSEAAHTEEHLIEMTLYSKFINGSGINMWVYDASEVPSGLTINDKTPAAVKIPRDG
jgi:hypothetical protein